MKVEHKVKQDNKIFAQIGAGEVFWSDTYGLCIKTNGGKRSVNLIDGTIQTPEPTHLVIEQNVKLVTDNEPSTT